METGPADAPLVSVIVPAWKAEATIGTAVRSVLEPDGPSLECLVVDDASPDGTRRAAEAAAAGDPRLRVLRQAENGGVSMARNRGLDEARGTWLLFLDADDCLLPGAIAALAAAAQDPALAVIGQRVSTDGTRTWVAPFYDNADIRRPGWKSLVANPGLLYYASGHGKLLHRSLADGLRFEGRALGDQIWVLQALLRAGDRIRVIPDVVYEWRRPRPDQDVLTITAARERSAALAAEAVAMAGTAYRVVGNAMAQSLRPDQVAALEAAYFDRLVRADLSAQLVGAVRRRDPALPSLLAAIERFLRDRPAWVVARSDALLERLVRPPLAHWMGLSPAARSSARGVVAAIVVARRAVAGRLAGQPPRRRVVSPERLGLWLIERLGRSTSAIEAVTAALGLLYAPYGPLERVALGVRSRLRAVRGSAPPREAAPS